MDSGCPEKMGNGKFKENLSRSSNCKKIKDQKKVSHVSPLLKSHEIHEVAEKLSDPFFLLMETSCKFTQPRILELGGGGLTALY